MSKTKKILLTVLFVLLLGLSLYGIMLYSKSIFISIDAINNPTTKEMLMIHEDNLRTCIIAIIPIISSLCVLVWQTILLWIKKGKQ